MDTIKVRVVGGKLIGEAPPGFAEGTELDLCLADTDEPLTEVQLAELDRSLEAAWKSIQAGRGIPAAEVLAELRSER